MSDSDDHTSARRLRLLEPGCLLAGSLVRNFLHERFALCELVAGDHVGVYRIERELGRGGMGVVYLAARDDGEYEQVVALKWLPDSARDEASAARFRDERQILANLRHPGIARLVDGGRGVQGHLWFAMEFVDGAPLDEHCAARSLARPARLHLLVAVLDAVAFAHARLVIHRDIKPRNVLVDAEGLPRLLDFGIAALAGAAAAPAYSPGFASPEQVACGEIGVASDIWQLGQLGDRVLSAGAATASAPLPADLRAILDKACAPEPSQRYATVDEFRTELLRFLSHRPVRARRGGLAHRARLLLRRHPWAVGIGVSAMIAFFTTVIGFTAQLKRERDEAERARDTTQAVSDFIVRDLLSAADPWSGGRSDARVAVVVEAAVDKVDQHFPQRPEVAGLLHLELGRILSNLGRQESALRSLNRAGVELTVARGALAAPTLEARYQRAKVAQRELKLREVQAALGELRADAARAGIPALVRRIDADLAWNRGQSGDYAGCYGEYRRLQESGTPDDAFQQVKELTGLSFCEYGLGRYADAAQHARQGWDFGRQRLGEFHPQTLDMPWVLSRAETALGHFDAALAAAERAHEGMLRVKGEQNSGVAAAAQQIGYVHSCAGRPRDALGWLDKSVSIRLAVLSADDPRLANARSLRALARFQIGDTAAAQADMADARRLLETFTDAHDIVRASVLRDSALLNLALEDYAAAATDFEAAQIVATRLFGASDARTVLLQLGLGVSRVRRGDSDARALVAAALPPLASTPSCYSGLLQQGRDVLVQSASPRDVHR